MALVDLLNGGLIELKFGGFGNSAGDKKDPQLYGVDIGSKDSDLVQVMIL